MGANCCHDDANFGGASRQLKRALWIVIAINAVMFVTEITAGVAAGSQALQADALDFFADSATYAISLMVLGASLRVRARAALFKGASLALMAAWILGSTAYKTFSTDIPEAEVMGIVGFAALIANLISVLLLLKFRDGDSNMRSVWLCSRNDAIGNVAVMLAASGVWASATAWPDLIVATAMASLFVWSSTQIIRQALGELKMDPAAAV